MKNQKRNNFKLVLSMMLVMCMIFVMAGCSKGEAAPTQEASAQLEEFNIVLDWYPNAVHAFIYDAIEKGYYEEEGLKVNIQFPSNTNDGMSMPAAGKADVGIYYLQSAVEAIANQDLPVKAIGTIVQKPLNIIMSLKEKNITEPKDLIGKTVGYSGQPASEILVKSIVESGGGKIEDVNLIDIGFDLINSMTTGNVDATIGAMANHEVPAMQEAGFDVNYFYINENTDIPDYYELILVAGDKLIKENPEKLQKFLRASKRGFEDMKANPEESLEILLSHQNAENFPLVESVEKQSIDMLLPLMETENAEFLSQDKEIWQKNIDWMLEKGIITKKLDAANLIADLK
ncbi:MAG: ABC transporter substrate-binding protein [Proteocatella sp.]